MRKIFSIVLASLMVLGLAATAFAIHAEIPAETQSVVAAGTTQITLGGEIRTRGWFFDNFTSGLGQDANSAAWWDQRVRLSLDAVVAPGVQGYVQIETHGDISGDKYVWGTGDFGPGRRSDGLLGTNEKPGVVLDILQAWILYQGQGLFGFNSGVKIGHMPLKLGYGQFFDNTQYGDDALVLFMDPVKGLHIGALAIKFNECGSAFGNCRFDNTNDLDGYVGLMTYKWADTHTAGLNYTYLNLSDFDLKMSNLELHADGKIGAFGYKAAADIQFGSIFDNPDADFGGYALSAYLNYDFNASNVPLNLRGSLVYGSGDDDLDNDLDEFLPFTGNTQNYSFIYEYNHATTAGGNGGFNSPFPSDGHASGVANTTYVNLGLDWNATKDMMLSADLYGFWASKTGVFEDAIGDDVDSSAGWEIDGKFKYKVARNLVYQIDLGYFDPGGFYEDVYNVDEGVTAMRHSLTLSF